MMDIIVGDLIKLALDKQFDVIVHGANCFHKMGAGIAGQISTQFPPAYQADLETKKGDPAKLGTLSHAALDPHQLIVINAYTQFQPGKCPVEVLYPSIRCCFKQLVKFGHPGISSIPVRIGIPQIGCGIAGGDWDIVQRIIDEEMQAIDRNGSSITAVIWG